MDDLFAIRCLSDRLEQPAPPPIVMPKSLSSPAPGAPSKLHAGASPTKGVPQPWKKGMGGASTAAEGVPFTHLRGCPRTGVAGSRDGRRRRVATYRHGGMFCIRSLLYQSKPGRFFLQPVRLGGLRSSGLLANPTGAWCSYRTQHQRNLRHQQGSPRRLRWQGRCRNHAMYATANVRSGVDGRRPCVSPKSSRAAEPCSGTPSAWTRGRARLRCPDRRSRLR